MPDKKIEQRAVNADSTKSTQAAPATESSQPSGRARPASVSRWKHWKFRSSIALMVLGAIAIIVYLVVSGLAKQYAGLGAALCAIALGGFLIWHAMHLFLEQDVIEEQKINKDRAKTSSPQQNADKGTNPTTPPSKSKQNFE